MSFSYNLEGLGNKLNTYLEPWRRQQVNLNSSAFSKIGVKNLIDKRVFSKTV